VLPYIKSINVFYCPDDSDAGAPMPVGQGGWAGVGISWAANGLYSTTYGWISGTSPINGFIEIGVVGTGGYGGWLEPCSQNQSYIVHPADSIMLAEKFSADSTAMGWSSQQSGYGPDSVIAGTASYGGGWGDQNIPDSTQPAANAYPTGPNGAVSAHHNGRANFVFCDGHAKAMVPSATDPDPVNQPQNNMWNVTRL